MTARRRTRWTCRCRIVAAALLLVPAAAQAWGGMGHEIVGLIAEHDLTAAVRRRVAALLTADGSGLTADTGIAAEATWADRYRDSDRDGARIHYLKTRAWHYVDIEIAAPNLQAACFGVPPLAPGQLASRGPSEDCVVDKIDEFRRELADPIMPRAERLLALQFLLHLVGDLHQPLHCSDDHDQGGNRKRVVAPDHRPGTLHHYWDTVFVANLGRRPTAVARRLLATISPRQRRRWRAGTPREWAMQSFRLAQAHAYGGLPTPGRTGVYRLDAAYVNAATAAVRLQLQRAGVRLAYVLNTALADAAAANAAQTHGAAR